MTGITHLRESTGGHSITGGTIFKEVQAPDRVTIDKGDIVESRLGIHGRVAGGASHDWYRVVSDRTGDLSRRRVYIREGMFHAAAGPSAAPAAGNVDWTRFDLTEGGAYGVERENSPRLYGKRNANPPQPVGLYRRETALDTFGRPVQVWTPNVRFVQRGEFRGLSRAEEDRRAAPHVEKGMRLNAAIALVETERAAELRDRIASLRTQVHRAIEQEGRTGPSMGIVGRNDCGKWAGMLRGLITDALGTRAAVVAEPFHLADEDRRKIKNPGEMGIGSTMQQIFGGSDSNYHAATIVAKDGISVVTLEGHVEKQLDAPTFHVYHGLSGFCTVNNEFGRFEAENQRKGLVHRPGIDDVRRARTEALGHLQQDLSRIDNLRDLEQLMSQYMEVTAPARPVAAQPQGRGGCFLTTACTRSKNLADDCEELTVLRSFRDGYLRGLPEGPGLIAHYYEIAPRIVAAVDQRSDYPEVYDRLYGTIRECVNAIQNGRNEQAMERYKAMVLDLSRYCPSSGI